MKLISKIFLILIIYVAILIASSYSLTYSHEIVHQVIYKSYGIESNISLKLEPLDGKLHLGATYPEQACPTEECTLANNLNEVFEYQLGDFMIFLWMMLLTLNLTIVIANHYKKQTLNNLLDILISK